MASWAASAADASGACAAFSWSAVVARAPSGVGQVVAVGVEAVVVVGLALWEQTGYRVRDQS